MMTEYTVVFRDGTKVKSSGRSPQHAIERAAAKHGKSTAGAYAIKGTTKRGYGQRG
jgi:hypothetical protein